MKNLASILTRITNSPWLMTEDALRNLLDILERHMNEDEESIERFLAVVELEDRESAMRISNGVGVLPLAGPIFPKANMLTQMSGATSLEMFRDDFRALLANDSVHSIILDVDSPGGVSDMVMEMGQEILAARGVKPVVAVANTLAASAAYWLASQASEFYITPSGVTGSLGVYTVHKDDSKKLEMQGITKTVIHGGKAKAGHEQPMNDLTRANMQALIDDTYNDFVSAIAQSRNLSTEYVEENFGQGGIVSPRRALEVGMVDGIETIESVHSRMAENGGVVGNGSAVAAMSALQGMGYTVTTTDNTSGKSSIYISVEQEKSHGDPGPNGEPIPREPAEQGDKAIEGGWRVPTPPGSSFPIKKGSINEVNREQLEALATKLGIAFADDTSDEDLFTACMGGVDDVVGPLIEAEQQAGSARNFERDYPEHAEELRRLRDRDEESEARLFAERWERFEIEDDNGTKRKLTSGFPSLVLDHIESIHLKIARRQLVTDDVANLLNSIAQSGTVDYGERGSARSQEFASGPTTFSGMTVREIRQAYAEEVKKVMVEDNLDRRSAQSMVNERNPELAEMYRTAHLRQR